MIVDIHSKLWRKVHKIIADTDEGFILSFLRATPHGKENMAAYLSEQYNIHLQTDGDGRWTGVEFKDLSVITMLILKHKEDLYEID